jgi:hypothetical protein
VVSLPSEAMMSEISSLSSSHLPSGRSWRIERMRIEAEGFFEGLGSEGGQHWGLLVAGDGIREEGSRDDEVGHGCRKKIVVVSAHHICNDTFHWPLSRPALRQTRWHWPMIAKAWPSLPRRWTVGFWGRGLMEGVVGIVRSLIGGDVSDRGGSHSRNRGRLPRERGRWKR